jgi:hypothetical protein
MRGVIRDKETIDVVPERKTDSQSQTRRLSLQGVLVCIEEKEETLPSEEGKVGQASLT